ncbi:MAG: protein kinase [Alphaproteobacteria bacterium]
MAIEHRSALTPGYRLHEYQVESVLGHGGFGITYLATDNNLHKKVAIKEFLPNDVAVRVDGSTVEAKSSSDMDTFQWGLERFTQEAQTLARFRHPNVIQISRYFEANGTAYFVMDYEDGKSLKDILQAAGTLPQSEIEELLYPLLHALDAVHHAGAPRHQAGEHLCARRRLPRAARFRRRPPGARREEPKPHQHLHRRLRTL